MTPEVALHSLRRLLSRASIILCAILTLFPDVVKRYLDESILGIAQSQGKLQVELVNFRNFTTDRHHTVDDRPFGGGPGMVMKPDPIFDAVEETERRFGPMHKVLLCPRGRRFTQPKAHALSREERLLLLCGRYEGFDERIREGFEWDEISIGDFVLAGGELPALCVIEAAVRLIPGVLGCDESVVSESFESDLFDFPQYTRPRVFRGMPVPDVLVSGDHGAVARWRREQAEHLTQRHPDRIDDRTPDRLPDRISHSASDSPDPGPRPE